MTLRDLVNDAAAEAGWSEIGLFAIRPLDPSEFYPTSVYFAPGSGDSEMRMTVEWDRQGSPLMVFIAPRRGEGAALVTAVHGVDSVMRSIRSVFTEPRWASALVGSLPPQEVLLRKITAADVHAHSWYFIVGPGRELADGTDCDHGVALTSTCSLCP